MPCWKCHCLLRFARLGRFQNQSDRFLRRPKILLSSGAGLDLHVSYVSRLILWLHSSTLIFFACRCYHRFLHILSAWLRLAWLYQYKCIWSSRFYGMSHKGWSIRDIKYSLLLPTPPYQTTIYLPASALALLQRSTTAPRQRRGSTRERTFCINGDGQVCVKVNLG